MSLSSLHPATIATRLLTLGVALATLAGCQSLSSTGSSAWVRVIDLSPGTPAVDIYQGNTAVAYNLNFGTVTSYVAVAPRSSTLTVDTAGSRQVLSVAEATFVPGSYYTVLVSNPASSLRQVVLTDHTPASSAGRFLSVPAGPLVRFVHQANASGPVDVYLLPAGQRITATAPVLTNLAPGSTTAYLPVGTCTCTAVLLPAGTPPSAAMTTHASAQIDFTGTAAHTLILVQAEGEAAPGVQVIATSDAEPAN